ncbi:hypothetical protein LP420_15510 [Massilia sp. B-10]|nr:hypothetical protein LP420_15510 [Massilia sp. B-10]
MTPLLDPAKVAGKVLVCDRGANVLVNKSANGKAAGAGSVIIANVTGGADTIINQAHSLSTVHLKAVDGNALKVYLDANPGSATASLGNLRGVVDPTVQAPQMSGSSSRGPNVANANIMKPDVSAPGSDILVSVTADLSRDQRNAVAGSSGADQLGVLLGHLDGQPAHRRYRGPAQAEVSELDPGHDQVGPDDDRLDDQA